MRLDKFICNNSDYSRAQIHTLVKQGIICVNGEVVTKANYTICEDDLVSVNNINITASGPRYFMLHKPQGYVCANSDSEHPTVLDLINEVNKQELQIAGRLDLDTTGLVLLTDDGKWNHKITSPKHEHTKTYLVKTANAITQDTIVVFAQGITLKNETKPTLPAVLNIIDSHQARLEIHEGKYQGKEYGIKEWRQIDLSKLNIEKLKQEFEQAKYKNIEISDLRAFISDKLENMIERNVTRINFAQKLQEIIDNYNNGRITKDNFVGKLFEELDLMTEEEKRSKREGLTEDELEIFDLIKKDSLTPEEKKKVKDAAKNLLHRLKEERPKVLINDWHKDSQSKLQVETTIKTVLNNSLPETYDRVVYSSKCDAVIQHYYTMAVSGDRRAFV